MRSGALDRIVTLERFTTTENEYGEEIEAWAPLRTVAAQVVQQSGREFLAAAMTQAEVRVLFRIRWIEGIRPTDRINYEGRLHNIHEVKELGRREGLDIMTVAAG